MVNCSLTFLNLNSYAGGQSEVVMGKAFKKYGWKRNDIVVTTKVSQHWFLLLKHGTRSQY